MKVFYCQHKVLCNTHARSNSIIICLEKRLCIAIKKNTDRLTLTCKNKGKRPGKFTIIATKEVKTSLKACMVDFAHYISQIQVSVDK